MSKKFCTLYNKFYLPILIKIEICKWERVIRVMDTL